MGPGQNGARKPGPPPFGEIPGSVWDGFKYFKMDPKLARVSTTTMEDSWDKESVNGTGVTTPSASEEAEEAEPVPPSAFYCTPANPPAVFFEGNATLTAMPRSQQSSLAVSRRYKRARLQAHASALRFHSRDSVPHAPVPVTINDDDSSDDGPEVSLAAEQSIVETHVDSCTGAVLWTRTLQQKSLRSLSIDLGRRKKYTDQKLSPFNPRAEYYRDTRPSEYDSYDWQYDLGAANPPRPLAMVIEQQTRMSTDDRRHARNMAFTPSGSSLRGIETANFVHLATAGDWYDEDDQENAESSIPWHTTMIKPNQHWSAGNSSLAHHLRVPSTNQEQSHSVESYDFECVVSLLRSIRPGGHKIDSIHIAPSTIPAAPCPRFIQTADPWNNIYHTAICVNKGTGYCWVGFRSGSIQVIDIVRMFKRRVDPGISKRYWPIVAQTSCDKAVTNLIAVGPAEAIAAYSDGSLVRLRKPHSDSAAYEVQQYQGHVNEGNMNIAACADADSRLIAVCGTDGCVRIWHFDNPVPLNSPWNQPRNGDKDKEIDLAPNPAKVRNDRLLARSKKGASASVSASISERDVFHSLFAELAMSELDEIKKISKGRLQKALNTPLSQLQCRNVTCMAFVHTSWVADRDAQWEHTREFDEDFRPRRLERAGLLPALCVCVNTDDGPRILYFEQSSALAAV